MKNRWRRDAVPYAGRNLDRPRPKSYYSKKVTNFKAGGITREERRLIREWIESGVGAEELLERLQGEFNRDRRLETVQNWVDNRAGEPYRRDRDD